MLRFWRLPQRFWRGRGRGGGLVGSWRYAMPCLLRAARRSGPQGVLGRTAARQADAGQGRRPSPLNP